MLRSKNGVAYVRVHYKSNVFIIIIVVKELLSFSAYKNNFFFISIGTLVQLLPHKISKKLNLVTHKYNKSKISPLFFLQSQHCASWILFKNATWILLWQCCLNFTFHVFYFGCHSWNFDSFKYSYLWHWIFSGIMAWWALSN